MPDPEDRDAPGAAENQRTVTVLRDTFAAITNRLTPEVEPATIYLPYAPISDANSPLESAE